jgi:hypothetical protein
VSGLSLVELLRLSLKGAIGREDAGLLLDAIPAVCRVVWPDWSIGERSARLSRSCQDVCVRGCRKRVVSLKGDP